MTNLDSILKSRDIALPTKVLLVKTMVFPVVMYGCESWTIKKAEHQRIDAFELWCWWRLLRVPWTASRSNQSFLKEISPEYSLEGLMLKLKLQYFGHLVQRTDSLEKTLKLGKIEGMGRRGLQRMRWLNGITNSMDMSLSISRSWWWTGKPGVLQSIGSQRVRHDWVTELNWTAINDITGIEATYQVIGPTSVVWLEPALVISIYIVRKICFEWTFFLLSLPSALLHPATPPNFNSSISFRNTYLSQVLRRKAIWLRNFAQTCKLTIAILK